MKNARKNAFTLLELVLVITIIAILSAISIGLWRNAISSMRSKQAMASRKTILTAIAAYKAEHGEYPAAIQKFANYGTTPGQSSRIPLGDEATKRVIDELVSESEKGHTLMDISTLYVRVPGGDVMQYSDAKREGLVPEAWGYMCGDASFRKHYLGYNARTDTVYFYYVRTSKKDNIDYEKEDETVTIFDTDGTTELNYGDGDEDDE